MTLLERVAAHLADQQVPNALIGAAALAVHGVSRSTFAQDLLALDRRVLNAAFWTPLAEHASIEVRRGDADDPLAGVVRLTREGERDVDVVVGRHGWQEALIGRATRLGTGPLRVVERPDLILLKLYAGGIQDRWDIEQLLSTDARDAVAAIVEAELPALPARCRELWASIRPARA